MIKNKICTISITGKPNVGKSTLLNNILNEKKAIISPKPQTTRKQIKGIKKFNNYTFVFIDTPGFHFAHNKLDLFLNSEIKKSYQKADLVYFLIDPTRAIDEEDKQIIKFIESYDIRNVILVITKKDIVDDNRIKKILNELQSLLSFNEYVLISSKDKTTIENLLNISQKYSIDKNDEIIDDEDDNFVITEIIREQIIFNTKKEIPYSTFVAIENKKFEDNLFTINATIFVEKDSQKPILIGKNGSMLTKIGTASRKKLLEIYDCKVNLKLFVKVKEDWRNNENFLKENKYFL